MKTFSPSRVFGWFVLGLLGASLVQSCGGDSFGERAGGSGATGGGPRPDAGDATVDVATPDSGGAGGEAPYNPLCGVVDCLPDRANACPSSTAGSPGNAGASTGGSGGSSGSSSAGEHGSGAGGAPGGAGEGPGGAPSGGGMGGEGGQGANGNGGGEGGTPGTGAASGSGGSGSEPIVNSCQVRPKNGDPRAQCVPAGPGEADDPCLSGSDCAPGLACVREGAAGQCRPYCCDEGSCTDRTHCFERTLFGVTPELRVPVCVPSVDCGLAEPYPCLEDTTCTCPAGLACMVVGADGTTTCAEPGPGRDGYNCPCDWGFVCSQVTNRCMTLCQTAAPEATCATGMCQISPELPPGWGVCVGMPRPGD
jgi:hypothetical protein